MAAKAPKPEGSAQDFSSLSSFTSFARKHLSRQMIMERLYGPIGAIILHLILLIILLNIVTWTEPEKPPKIKITMAEQVQSKPINGVIRPKPVTILNNVSMPETAMLQNDMVMPSAVVEPDDRVDNPDETDNLKKWTVDLDRDAVSSTLIDNLFRGRTDKGRERALRDNSHGQAKRTEPAVDRALEWLKNHQLPNGAWHADKSRLGPAFTGMAVLTFLAHGKTPKSEHYGKTVQKGLKWLTDNQRKGKFSSCSYAHGIATYAVSEGYALTLIPILRQSMDQAIEIIIKGQQGNGGWNYGYNKGAGRRDTSVMGWQIQALKAAYATGCTVPGLPEALNKAIAGMKLQYVEHGTAKVKVKTKGALGISMGKLDSPRTSLKTEPMGKFVYAGGGDKQATGGGSPTMTSVGTLCLELLGEGASAEAKGGRAYLRTLDCDWKKPVSARAFYLWYYQTQAIFQGQFIPGNASGDEDWTRWNDLFAKTLVDNQNEDGSWRSPDPAEDGSWILDNTGSVYSTALGALTLMVYYRILPTYKQQNRPADTAHASLTAADKNTESVKVKIE